MTTETALERMSDLADYLNISMAELEDEDSNDEEGRQYELVLIRSNAIEMAKLAEELLKGTRFESRQ